MQAVDTNLLVRYITQDGREAAAVSRHLERECTRECPGFVCQIVLCELVWVLRHAYKYDRSTVAGILEKLLSTVEFEIECADVAWRALAEYREGPADFADYLIGQVAGVYDAIPVHTLDQKAAKNAHFVRVDVNP